MRYWISATSLVAGVAGLKTLLMVSFVIGPANADAAVISGLFALFFALTAGVAYVCFTQLKIYLQGQRKKRLAPGAGETVAKETVIARYAPEWGLSQAEADVAIFVAKGFSNSEVADMRGCAIATVKSQLGSIYNKSGLESRYQLISFVTDEVVAMAKEAEADQPLASTAKTTKSILPLVGRTKNAEPVRAEA